jgi:hypothetical protein
MAKIGISIADIRAGALDRFPYKFSGGQHQRIGIGDALASHAQENFLMPPVSCARRCGRSVGCRGSKPDRDHKPAHPFAPRELADSVNDLRACFNPTSGTGKRGLTGGCPAI